MRQYSVNDFQSFALDNQSAALSPHSKVYVLAGGIAKKAMDTVIAPFKN
jgi:hypothetical protein